MTIPVKALIDSKPFVLDLKKQINLLEFMIELDIQHCLALKNMMLFTIELDMLQA